MRPGDDRDDRLPPGVQAARAQWQWRGRGRPAFAVTPGPEQFSVWDYPRPPRLVPDEREVVIRWGDREIARTRKALRLLETSHPPSFYLPLEDVAAELLKPATGSSFCEWKGYARYWSLVDGPRRLDHIAWGYPHPFGEWAVLAKRVAFYAKGLECSVDGAAVRPQAGGFYGGWITPELTGPFKGDPGSEAW